MISEKVSTWKHKTNYHAKNCEKIVIIILVSKTTVGKIYVGIIEFEVNYAWGVMV